MCSSKLQKNELTVSISLSDGDMAIVWYYFVDAKTILVQIPEKLFINLIIQFCIVINFLKIKKCSHKKFICMSYLQCAQKNTNPFYVCTSMHMITNLMRRGAKELFDEICWFNQFFQSYSSKIMYNHVTLPKQIFDRRYWLV